MGFPTDIHLEGITINETPAETIINAIYSGNDRLHIRKELTIKKKCFTVFAITCILSFCIVPSANAAVQVSYYLSSYDAYLWP